MEDKDTREFDDKDTEVVDAQVIEPTEDADDNDDEYEKVCFVCRRPESKTGKMITMQGNLHICPDCMQKTFDTMKNAGFDFSSDPAFFIYFTFLLIILLAASFDTNPVGSILFTGLPPQYTYQFSPSFAGSSVINLPVSGSYILARK